MKKVIFLLFVSIVFANTSCKKLSIATDVPECIKTNIETNKGRDDWYIGNVEEYRFQGKLVYAFNPDTKIIADASTEILTNDCVRLCSVGGFGGTAVNLCNGSNFYQDAVFVRVIWDKYK